MFTLPFGHKRPDDGDLGSTFFDALRDNITLDDAHNHDGVNSPVLILKNVVAVPDTGWTAVGDGSFKQTVTMPAGHEWTAFANNKSSTIAVFGSGGLLADVMLYPKLVKLTATTFEVHMFVNDQALNILLT